MMISAMKDRTKGKAFAAVLLPALAACISAMVRPCAASQTLPSGMYQAAPNTQAATAAATMTMILAVESIMIRSPSKIVAERCHPAVTLLRQCRRDGPDRRALDLGVLELARHRHAVFGEV